MRRVHRRVVPSIKRISASAVACYLRRFPGKENEHENRRKMEHCS
jgi:hypothetical protein